MEKRRGIKGWGFGPMTEMVLEACGYEPTGVEQARVVGGRHRFEVVVGGDQSGKSKTAGIKFALNVVQDIADYAGVGESETLLYWLVGADYERTRAEWGYMEENMRALGYRVEASKRVDPGKMEGWMGGKRAVWRLETKSANDPRTLAMFGPQGIIICEASQVDLETFQRCMGRVGPKRGWLFMSGSYEGSLGWYPGLVKAWAYGSKECKSYRIPATTNWHLYPGGEDDPELLRMKANSSDEWYMERVMGIASPPRGVVFGEFRSDVHIRALEYDETLPVYIWEDPGYGHAHAIEVAQVRPGIWGMGGQVQVIDEIYERGVITEDMVWMCKQRGWWKNENKKLVIDPHYKDEHHGSHSIAEIWRGLGLTPANNPRVKIAEGTERLKTFLKLDVNGVPGIVFDPKCKGVLSELGAYPNPFDGQTKVYQWKLDREGNIIGEEPDDRYNDGCKAIIYGLVEQFGLANVKRREYFPVRRIGMREEREGGGDNRGRILVRRSSVFEGWPR